MTVRNVEDAGEAPDYSRAECWYRIPEITKDVPGKEAPGAEENLRGGQAGAVNADGKQSFSSAFFLTIGF